MPKKTVKKKISPKIAYDAWIKCDQNSSQASKILGIHRATLKKYCDQYMDENPSAQIEEVEQEPIKAPFLLKEQRYKDKITNLNRELKILKKETIKAEDIREQIFGLSGKPQNPPEWLIDKETRNDYEMTPNLMLSDWHWGEVVEADQVDGINHYNREVSLSRVKKLQESLFQICFDQLNYNEYPGIVINLMGDMITGMIHQELERTNDQTDQECVLDLVDVLIAFIKEMKRAFKNVHIVGVVGNHGRSTQKPMFKNAIVTSYDWLVYQILERFFINDESVTFQVPNGFDAYYKIYNQRYMVTHGDRLGVRGGDGIIGSIGPIRRGEYKIRRQKELVGHPFDTILLGHYHDYMELPGCSGFVNGSLIGMSEYGHGSRFMPSPIVQGLHFVDQQRISIRAPIYIDGAPVEKTNTWVSVMEGVQ
jgi:hypothetical protein